MRSSMLVSLADHPGISPADSARLGADLSESFVALLGSLTPDEWSATTRCAPWTPKDMAAHILGWAEAVTSFRELGSQVRRALGRVGEYGNVTDAQNSVQVDDRRDLTTDELIERLRSTLPRFERRRRTYGTALRYLPIYVPYLGGPTTGGYVFNTIFLRDSLIHRLDICDAIGRQPKQTDSDERVIVDMLADWARRTAADVQIDDGEAVYVAGAGINTIRAPLHHVIDVLSGRRPGSSLDIDGDRAAVEAWLARRVPI